MVLQNPQRIATGDRSVLTGITRQHHTTLLGQFKKPLHVVNAHRTGLIQDNQVTGGQHGFGMQQTLQRHGFKALFPQDIRCRRCRRAEKWFNLRFGAGGDQLA
jgi:hypothetical protein